MNLEPVSILLTGDDSVALPVAVALRSIIETASPETRERLQLFVIHQMTEQSQQQIIDSCDGVTVNFVASEGLTKHLPDGQKKFEYLKNVAWLRVFMGDLLPADVNKVLYVDSDTLARQDVGLLFDLDLQDMPLGAVIDYRPDFRTVGWTEVAEHVFTGDERYFNSGVLLCNVDQWRAMNISQRVVELMRAIGPVPNFMDQDALNVVFAKSGWTELDDKWNNRTFTRLIRRREADPQRIAAELEAAAILHFPTPYKPWRDNYPDGPGRAVYRSVQDLTAFADYPLEHFVAQGWADGVYIET